VPYTVGLTGGIGSGKSTVEQLFQTFGVDIIDTDAIAHLLTGPNGLGIPSIQSQFGPDFLNPDGSLNRAVMRQLVFGDPDAKHKLELILHPLIRAEVDIQLGRVAPPYAILAVPLLIETGAYTDRVDRVLVVDCTEEQQVRRTSARSKLSEQEVRNIMAAQVDRKQRIRHADDIILNNAELAQLLSAVAVLDRRFRALAAVQEAT
jgi:dephospho-CoA kinase